MQLFTKNANQWAARPLTDDDVRLFRRTCRATGMKKTIAHDSYLINLASPNEDLFRKSIEAFVVEMERAEALGLDYLVAHPGSHTGTDEATGLGNVVRGLDEVYRRCAGFGVRVLLETTAGQGLSLGHRFEHLAWIMGAVAQPERLGVCLDTCHVFAAGYPLAPKADYQATMAEFDRVVGLKRLRVFHVNDSKKPLGSRVDRHAHIGQGCLGLEPFRLLANDLPLPRSADDPGDAQGRRGPGDGRDQPRGAAAWLRFHEPPWCVAKAWIWGSRTRQSSGFLKSGDFSYPRSYVF